MSDLEFMTGICQKILNPLPITAKEKEEILHREYIMEQMNPEEDDFDPMDELFDYRGVMGHEEMVERYDDYGYETYQDGWDSDGNPRMVRRKWGIRP